MPYEFVDQPVPTGGDNWSHVIGFRDQNGVIVQVTVQHSTETEAEADATFLSLFEHLQGWTRVDSNGFSGSKTKGFASIIEEV